MEDKKLNELTDDALDEVAGGRFIPNIPKPGKEPKMGVILGDAAETMGVAGTMGAVGAEAEGIRKVVVDGAVGETEVKSKDRLLR